MVVDEHSIGNDCETATHEAPKAESRLGPTPEARGANEGMCGLGGWGHTSMCSMLCVKSSISAATAANSSSSELSFETGHASLLSRLDDAAAVQCGPIPSKDGTRHTRPATYYEKNAEGL